MFKNYVQMSNLQNKFNLNNSGYLKFILNDWKHGILIYKYRDYYVESIISIDLL